MGKTRKQSKVLCYPVIESEYTGPDPSGIYTPDQFLNLTKRWQNSKYHCFHWKTGKYVCPPRGNLKEWIKWSGAKYETKHKCRKETAKIKRMVKANTRKLERIRGRV